MISFACEALEPSPTHHGAAHPDRRDGHHRLVGVLLLLWATRRLEEPAAA